MQPRSVVATSSIQYRRPDTSVRVASPDVGLEEHGEASHHAIDPGRDCDRLKTSGEQEWNNDQDARDFRSRGDGDTEPGEKRMVAPSVRNGNTEADERNGIADAVGSGETDGEGHPDPDCNRPGHFEESHRQNQHEQHRQRPRAERAAVITGEEWQYEWQHCRWMSVGCADRPWCVDSLGKLLRALIVIPVMHVRLSACIINYEIRPTQSPQRQVHCGTQATAGRG